MSTTLLIDQDDLERLYEGPLDVPDLTRVVLPDETMNQRLKQVLGRLLLKRLLLAATELFESGLSLEGESTLQHAVRSLMHQQADAVWDTMHRPEVASWVFLADQSKGVSSSSKRNQLSLYLGTHLLGHTLANREEGREFYVLPTDSNHLDITPFGRRIRINEGTGPLLIAIDDKRLTLSRSGSPMQTVLATSITKAEEWDNVSTIPKMAGDGPIVRCGGSWYDGFFPTDVNGRAGHLLNDMTDSDLEDFTATLSGCAELIWTYWPEAWHQLRSFIKEIRPLPSTGIRPHNASVHAFRGLITTSARATYLGAQSLVHETGHNRFSDIVDTFDLVEGEMPVVFSPLVQADRPLINVFHGCFAFLQDLHISVRLIGNVELGDGPSIEKYTSRIADRVAHGLRIIRKHARLTPHGQLMLDGLSSAFEQVSGNTG